MKTPSAKKDKPNAKTPPQDSTSKGPLVGSRTSANREKATLQRGRDALDSNPTEDESRARAI